MQHRSIIGSVALALTLLLAGCTKSANHTGVHSTPRSGDKITGSTTGPGLATTAAPSIPARPSIAAFGPDGFGKLKLGMNAQQALRSGVITLVAATPGDCQTYFIKAIRTRPARNVDGFIDPKAGVVLIAAAAM